MNFVRVKYLLFFCFVLQLVAGNTAYAQFLVEDFGTGCGRATSADGYTSTLGTWTVSNVGFGNNGADANEWFVSTTSYVDPAFVQVPAGTCDNSCLNNPALNSRTLHIGNTSVLVNIPPFPPTTFPADSGAIFMLGGKCTPPANLCFETNKRVESPVLNFLGREDINVRVTYLEGGSAPNNNGFLAYFDGSTWDNTFLDLPKTNTVCPNGEWTDILVPLPASADQNPNVRIGFYWTNNEGPQGTTDIFQPSLSIGKLQFFGNVATAAPTPAFTTAGPTTICIGESVSFINQSTSSDGVLWSFPGGIPNTSIQNNPTITYNSVGSFPVQITAINSVSGADSTAPVSLNFVVVDSCNEQVVADFTPKDTTICMGDSILFRDLSTGNPLEWAWFFPGATNRNFDTVPNPDPIVYGNTGVFEVSLIVKNNSNLDNLVISSAIKVLECFQPIPRYTVQKDSICKGECVQFFSDSRFTDSHLWIFQGADSLTDSSTALNPIVCYDSIGLWDVTLFATNAYGTVQRTFPFAISVADTPSVDLGPDIELLAGDITLINPRSGEGNRWIWLELGENPNNLDNPNFSLNCRTCAQPTASPKKTTTYIAYNVNNHGCFAQDTITVIVLNEYYIGVPSAFSPNLDGENDRLFVLGNGFFKIDFSVYNRFGQRVFNTTDPVIGWDGRFNGEILNPGVYAYQVRVTFLNGVEEVLSGNVTLIR